MNNCCFSLRPVFFHGLMSFMDDAVKLNETEKRLKLFTCRKIWWLRELIVFPSLVLNLIVRDEMCRAAACFNKNKLLTEKWIACVCVFWVDKELMVGFWCCDQCHWFPIGQLQRRSDIRTARYLLPACLCYHSYPAPPTDGVSILVDVWAFLRCWPHFLLMLTRESNTDLFTVHDRSRNFAPITGRSRQVWLKNSPLFRNKMN